MVKRMEDTHKRSSTEGTSNKGKGREPSLVGISPGRRPDKVKDLVKKQPTGCCHKSKKEKM